MSILVRIRSLFIIQPPQPSPAKQKDIATREEIELQTVRLNKAMDGLTREVGAAKVDRAKNHEALTTMLDETLQAIDRIGGAKPKRKPPS